MLDKLIKKYLNKISWLVILLFMGWLILFIYNNVYLTVNNIRVLKEVKKRVAETKINIEDWEALKKNIKWKKQPLADGELSVNPFK